MPWTLRVVFAAGILACSPNALLSNAQAMEEPDVTTQTEDSATQEDASSKRSSAGSGSWIITPRVEEWKGKMGDAMTRARYTAGNRLSDILWERVDDIHVMDAANSRISFGVDVHRRVYDNHDIGNTYTVADLININTSIPLFSKELLKDVAAGDLIRSFGVYIGTSEGLDLLNIRQVRPGNLTTLKSVPEMRDQVKNSTWYAEISNPGKTEAPITTLEEETDANAGENNPETVLALESLSILDPLKKARYGQFHNLISFPVDLPLTAERLSKLESGEIMSYNLSGTVQVGASVGWGVDLNTVFKTVAGDLSYSAYLRGDYRVTVMKEDGRYARVKLTKSWTKGRGGGLNGSTDKYEYFEGWVILGKRVLERTFYIVPFKIRADLSNTEAFDVGYRYDLANPTAREAYRLAMLGRMAYSDQLSGGLKAVRGQIDETGVEKIFTRNQKVSTDTFSTGAEFASILRHGDSSSYSDWDAVVTLPDGTRRLVTTDTVNQREWRSIFGMYERFSYNFRVNADVDRYNDGHGDALYMNAEANIEDSDTHGKEMRAYMVQVESALGEKEIFPRLPIHGPESQEEYDARTARNNESAMGTVEPPEANYHYSNFYYRMTFNRAQLEKFIQYPEKKMWEALEKAFDIEPGQWSSLRSRMLYQLFHSIGALANWPLYIVNIRFHDSPKLYHAKMILEDWKAIREGANVTDRARALGKMFQDKVYGRELIQLLRTVLSGEEIAYVASGTNQSFGRIWKQGTATVDFYPLPDRLSREIDFDRVETRSYLGDDSAVLEQLQFERVGPTGYELKFKTKHKPVAVYVRLIEDGGWSFNKTIGEFVLMNNGEYSAGENIVKMDPTYEPNENDSEATILWTKFAKSLIPGNQYYVSMAISKDGHQWGGMFTAKFYVPRYSKMRASTEKKPVNW